jgi:hypothetical protein
VLAKLTGSAGIRQGGAFEVRHWIWAVHLGLTRCAAASVEARQLAGSRLEGACAARARLPSVCGVMCAAARRGAGAQRS